MKMGKRKLYYILIASLLIAIIVVVTLGINKKGRTISQQDDEANSIETVEIINPTPNNTTEHIISAELIEDSLKDMGFLITQEYDCTALLNNSKVKSLLGFDLPFTESSYLISYDATVEAGIDFTIISVDVDEEMKEVIIHLPDAQIQNIVIDPNSFIKYEEKDGLGTKMTITDYNDSLQQFESTVTTKAIEKGLLEKAYSNAQALITNFVRNFIKDTDYRLMID